MKKLIKWFWPPLLMLLLVAGAIAAAWTAVNHDVPLSLNGWQTRAAANAGAHLPRRATIRDTTTSALAQAQAQAPALQQQYGMGELTIPAVDIDLTIYSVVTNNTLATGVARYFPDRQMGQGNNVYAAHNLDGSGVLLSRIGQLKNHAVIRQTDFHHVYQYRVVYNRVVKMTEVAVLKQTDEQRITLIRCEGPYHSRYRRVVIGRLQRVTPYHAGKAKAAPALHRAQRHAATLFRWQQAKWPVGLVIATFIVLLAIGFRGYYRETTGQHN